MLPKKHRLTKEKDFKKISGSGRPFFSSYFTLKSIANNSAFSRFGIVISTKVSKKATVRNRLKRQIREIIHLNKKNIKPGHDIAIYVKGQAVNKSYHELEKNLLTIFLKAKLLK